MAAEEWAKALVGKWVLHKQHRVIGKVAKLYDGVDDVYVSNFNNKPVNGPVIELSSGHGLVAREDDYVELTEAAGVFYQQAQKGLRSVLERLAALGAHTEGLSPEEAMALLVIALREQAVVLEHSLDAMTKSETRVSEEG